MWISLKLKTGVKISEITGSPEAGNPHDMACLSFYKAVPGAKLHINNRQYGYRITFYDASYDEKYLYTYDYAPEESWTSHRRGFLQDAYLDWDYTFLESGYFRVSVRRKDGKNIAAADAARSGEILEYEMPEEKPERKPYFIEEAQRVSEKIERLRKPEALLFAVMTDTHYTVNGTWEDTVRNIAAVNQQVKFDAIIHLGDWTDGMVPADVTVDYVNRMKQELLKCGSPVYAALGNHDSNYFKGNSERLTIAAQKELYLPGQAGEAYYYIDFGEKGLRCIFLASFDPDEEPRYGFWPKELEWLERTLTETPESLCVLIFSHEAPLARLDYWADEIRGGSELIRILQAYQRRTKGKLLGYLYGHTHADYVDMSLDFPLISIGCAKCESFAGMKPAGAVCWERKRNTVSQELWDAVLADPETGTLQLIRFGAGRDRKTEVNRRMLQKARRTNIWAHRGASAYAPENTLPAFQLAADMKADGVELDVHLTRDKEIVVIHDEKLERVSNVAGRVQDYTLKELKQFQFNCKNPRFPQVQIPTLREVYELLKPYPMFVNVELKTERGLNAGIEEKTAALTQDMQMEERVIFSSFNHKSVLKMKRLLPEAKTGFLYETELADAARYARMHGVDALHPDKYLLNDPDFMWQCRENKIAVHPYTLNEMRELWDCYEKGTEAVITNEPFKAAALLAVWEKINGTAEQIYVWGTGIEARKLLECIPGERVAGYIQTKADKAAFRGMRIYTPEEIAGRSAAVEQIVVANVFTGEIKKTCREAGIEESRCIFLFP